MKLGVYNAVLHDRSREEAIGVIAGLGLNGIEINAGGFLPTHIPNTGLGRIEGLVVAAAVLKDAWAAFSVSLTPVS